MAERRQKLKDVSLRSADAVDVTRTPVRSAMKKTTPYVPKDARDVTAELSAFSGRGRNGQPTGVSEAMRAQLPKPAGIPWNPTLRGEALAQALREQEENERRRADEQTREAQRRYEADLAEIARRRGVERVRPDVEEEQGPGEEVEDEPVDDDDNEARIAQLYREAEEAAARIRRESRHQGAAGSTSLSRTPPPSVPVPGPAQPTTASPPPVVVSPVIARTVNATDIDRLWDWIRADEDKGQAFLGKAITTSIELHRFVEELATNGVGRAIDVHSAHAGFFVLRPVDHINRVAMLHFYFAPPARGHFADLFPYILSGARQLIPPSFSLGVSAPAHSPDVMDRLLRPFNFVRHTVFMQKGS